MDDRSPVVGDSDGMRALATALRQVGTTVAACDSSVWAKAGSLEFVGPAATRLRAVLQSWHGDLGTATNALEDAADLLVRAAAEIDTERARLARGHQ
jgi:hypothetical protein